VFTGAPPRQIRSHRLGLGGRRRPDQDAFHRFGHHFAAAVGSARSF
jgi:hypothetical protein